MWLKPPSSKLLLMFALSFNLPQSLKILASVQSVTICVHPKVSPNETRESSNLSIFLSQNK